MSELRINEMRVALPERTHAELYFIGCVRTPWKTRAETPRQGDRAGPACVIDVAAPWRHALKGIEQYDQLEILYWLHEAPRDVVLQSPADDGWVHGAFSLRSPVRPNPIGTAIVQLIGVSDHYIAVRGLDCIDGTPLIDIKPERSLIEPIAKPKMSAMRIE
ncbi:tRNA (N6-threonylcarbamoyladenosine(37)-N6)-methyltransferase TrmO [Oryzifoliimicrobium ureilyticus]|uniref:tRNA (N6-threonylcarbamoyladenosine(37)-N6)-methyltransferase TrmO n=1 Tax=Oryzifoliimicrobium ureilyticus TaxID=3113724 RepID=UPI0030762CFB